MSTTPLESRRSTPNSRRCTSDSVAAPHDLTNAGGVDDPNPKAHKAVGSQQLGQVVLAIRPPTAKMPQVMSDLPHGTD